MIDGIDYTGSKGRAYGTLREKSIKTYDFLFKKYKFRNGANDSFLKLTHVESTWDLRFWMYRQALLKLMYNFKVKNKRDCISVICVWKNDRFIMTFLGDWFCVCDNRVCRAMGFKLQILDIFCSA